MRGWPVAAANLKTCPSRRKGVPGLLDFRNVSNAGSVSHAADAASVGPVMDHKQLRTRQLGSLCQSIGPEQTEHIPLRMNELRLSTGTGNSTVVECVLAANEIIGLVVVSMRPKVVLVADRKRGTPDFCPDLNSSAKMNRWDGRLL